MMKDGATGREEELAIGVIGGSGLYELPGLERVHPVEVQTPFGPPSDALTTGFLEGIRMVFLPRHGRGHRISPAEVNSRANIFAMKKLGVTRIISISAVGSMREEIRPGDMVVCDQFVDRTTGRRGTFFEGGIVAHVHFADPVCPVLSDCLLDAGLQVGACMHKGGTYLVIEGPQFSTRAESAIYRQWQVDVIGMTNLPEARLAREAEICYATLALATDYDCWRSLAEEVSVEAVLEVIQKNRVTAQRILSAFVKRVPRERHCRCANSLRNVILTNLAQIPLKTRKKLDLLIGKYLP